MKKTALALFLFVCNFFTAQGSCLAAEKIPAKYFYSHHCKHCLVIKDDFLQGVLERYRDVVALEYLDVSEKNNFELFLSLEKYFNVKVRVPAIVIGSHLLVGPQQIREHFESLVESYRARKTIVSTKISAIDVVDAFRSFSIVAIISAGLIDGVNPCAFAVILFFISFLSLMGYRKRHIAAIGLCFIAAVFLTYSAVGIGLFRGLYGLGNIFSVLKIIYRILGALCLVFAFLNVRDFIAYRTTKNPEAVYLKLPKPIRSRINAIIGLFYRKDKQQAATPIIVLCGSAFIVGFLVSLLEAVCTGQMYVPTIVFILKEPGLRLRAFAYLLLYNGLFVAPLIAILALALCGSGSKRLEYFFRSRLGLIKLIIAVVFCALGVYLLLGV